MSKSSKEYYQQYYQDHKEVIKQQAKASRERNKEHRRAYNKKRYEANKERHHNLMKEWNKNNKDKVHGYERKHRADRKEWFIEIKSDLHCKNCNEDRWYCLEFHHRDPNEKEGTISSIYWRWSKERILEEMEKCDVLCSNCHKAFHWEEKQNKGEV